MADSLQVLQQKIIDHPYFQKTKEITENNPCHINETVYHHLITTSERAEDAVRGKFVSNPDAKIMFEKWMESESYGMHYKDIAVIIALLHDIGKILGYKENGKKFFLNSTQKDGKTMAKGHEYWGSTLVPKILTDIGIGEDAASFVATIVRLHGTFFSLDFNKNKTLEEHISDMKTLGQGFEKEILFNAYIDVAICPIFSQWLQVVAQMFNSPTFYKKREYIVL